ncbi:MAG: hypothetical protein ACRD0Z_10180 [Acidimicrobiales bacterium]
METDPNTGLDSAQYSTWTGDGWTVVGSFTELGLQSVSCLSRSFCMAIGETTTPITGGNINQSGIAMLWNGSSWAQSVVVGGIGLPLISCATSDFCMAVGGFHASGDIYTIWNGSQWSPVSQEDAGIGLSPVGFDSVSCPSASLCVATDGGSGVNSQPSTDGPPVVYLWQAGSWSGTPEETETQAAIPGGSFSEVSCPSVTYCVIAGDGQYLTGTA